MASSGHHHVVVSVQHAPNWSIVSEIEQKHTYYELIPLQTVQYRTRITLISHRLHRRLLCDAAKLVKTVGSTSAS